MLVNAAGKPQTVSQMLHEGGIVVGFGTAKVVIEMRHMQVERKFSAEAVQASEKSGGIWAPGRADHETSPRRETVTPQ